MLSNRPFWTGEFMLRDHVMLGFIYTGGLDSKPFHVMSLSSALKQSGTDTTTGFGQNTYVQ